MSSDRRSTGADPDLAASALEDGLNSCRSVVKNYRAMLLQRAGAERSDNADGDGCGLEDIGQTNDSVRSDAGSDPGIDKS